MRWTTQSFWQRGHLGFCFTQSIMQQLWKEWLHSPHTTAHCDVFFLLGLAAEAGVHDSKPTDCANFGLLYRDRKSLRLSLKNVLMIFCFMLLVCQSFTTNLLYLFPSSCGFFVMWTHVVRSTIVAVQTSLQC